MIHKLILTAGILIWPSGWSAFAQPTESQPVPGTNAPVVSAASAEAGDIRDEPEAEPGAVADGESPELRPRTELYIPSVAHLVERSRESHLGRLMVQSSGLFAAGMTSGRGLSVEEWNALRDFLRDCPDTDVAVATFAPSTEGRPRWSIQLNWPVSDLVARIGDMLALPGMDELLEGVRLAPGESGDHELRSADTVLAVILADEDGGSRVVSDRDLPASPALYGQDADRERPLGRTDTLVYSRLNLSGTEKDSGAMFGTKIPWVESIRYQASVRESGEWSERAAINWNALIGAGAKTALKRTKQSFYIPREAFAAAVFSSPLLQGMLDVLAGLEPGTLMGSLGGLGGDRVGPELCFVLLPGTGILPFPDVVIQTRVRYASSVENAIRNATRKSNEQRQKDDRDATWHEIDVDGQTVFYHDGRSELATGFAPATYRRVLFIDERTDPDGNTRTFLNLILTSTDVSSGVRRWRAPLRGDQRVAVPSGKNVEGEGVLHWNPVYEHLHPWLNLGIAGLEPLAVLPETARVEPYLSEATVSVSAKYTGMLIRHVGPIPLGTWYLPLIVSSSLVPDESGSSDLSRERIASQRLQLFYKNAKLFRKDVGRWPVSVAELDGYIDFAGQPWLLKLRRSSRAALREGLLSLVTADKKDEEDEEEAESEIDDSLFVVEWGQDRWTLGIRPGTLEHLDQLFIDQDGIIHRVPSSPAEAGAPKQGRSEDPREAEAI